MKDTNRTASGKTVWVRVRRNRDVSKITCPRMTIWGEVQHQEKFAPGVWDVCTAGHGGIVVAVEVADRYISAKARELVGPPENGFYHFEEDCAWAIFAKENPRLVPQRWLEHVDRTLDAYYPEYSGGQLSLGLTI